MHDEHPVEGEYQPSNQADASSQPQQQQTARRRASGLGAIAAGLAAFALKFKALLAVSWTFILSAILWIGVFGWRAGLVVVLLIAAHEFGHYFAYRAYGLSVRAPVFIPFFGAYTAGAIAPSLEDDAYIALAGPLTGLALAGVCYAVGDFTGDRFWLACAYLSALLNFFNMIPVLPFDGGRVIGAIWPPLWIAGALIFVAAARWLHVPIIFVLLIAILGLPTMISAFRGNVDPRAATMTNGARTRVGLWYLATVIGLIYVLGRSSGGLPAGGML